MTGGQRYPTHSNSVLIGSKTEAGVRTGVELESTFQTDESTEAVKSFETGGYTKLALATSYTMGAAETGNSIEVKIEQSPDRDNWYQLVNDSTSGADSTITKREFTHAGEDGDTSDFDIFIDIAYKYVRVSCKETGVASNKGNVFMEATLSGL